MKFFIEKNIFDKYKGTLKEQRRKEKDSGEKKYVQVDHTEANLLIQEVEADGWTPASYDTLDIVRIKKRTRRTKNDKLEVYFDVRTVKS